MSEPETAPPISAHLRCDKCGATRTIAYGYNAMQANLWADEHWRENAARLGWTFKPTLCPACQPARPEIT